MTQNSRVGTSRRMAQTVFQWQGNLAHLPWDLTHFSVALFIQQMQDPYKWDTVRKVNEQAFQ